MATANMKRDLIRIEDREKDIADISKQYVENSVQAEIKRIQKQASKLEAPFTGECLNCGKSFKKKDKRRWCDDECRDEWQHYQDRRKLNR